MYYLTAENSFDSAHFLKGYKGKCSNIHGHRWKVSVHVCGEQLSKAEQTRGMLVDFSDIKDDLKEACEKLDHKLIIEEGSLKETTLSALEDEGFELVVMPFRPTAENLARYFYSEMKSAGYEVDLVEVYETPRNRAAYRE